MSINFRPITTDAGMDLFPPSPTQPIIHRWMIGQKEVSLIQGKGKRDGQDIVSYIENENGVETVTKIDLNVVGITPYIRRNVHLFHDLIGGNLTQNIDPFSIIPVLSKHCWTVRPGDQVPQENAHIKIALFGRTRIGQSEQKELETEIEPVLLKKREDETDNDFFKRIAEESDANKKPIPAWWALYNEQDQTKRLIKIKNISGPIKECLNNILLYRHPADSYSNNDDIRVVLTYGVDNSVQSIDLESLRQKSIFNATVTLDDNHGAITPICSVWPNFSRGSSLHKQMQIGHAMIAVETIINHLRSLIYVHALKTPQEANPETIQVGATRIQVEEKHWPQVIISPTFKNNVFHGPTWRVSKEAVENMLAPIIPAFMFDSALPFTIGRQVAAYLIPRVHKVRQVSLKVSLASAPAMLGFVGFVGCAAAKANSRSRLWRTVTAVPCAITAANLLAKGLESALNIIEERYDCLKWAKEQYLNAGIILKIPSSVVSPFGFVKYLNDHPEAVTFEADTSV